MKRTDLMTEHAINYLEKPGTGIIQKDKKQDHVFVVPKEYDNYAASFGTSLLQMGAKTACFFYEAANQNSEQNKHKITDALLAILKAAYPGQFDRFSKLSKALHNKNGEALYSLSLKIMDAAIALKIALRTYKIIEKDEQGQ
jgi:hypothetical protein